MTATNWEILIPAVVAILTAGAAYLKSRTATKNVQAVAKAVNEHVTTVHND